MPNNLPSSNGLIYYSCKDSFFLTPLIDPPFTRPGPPVLSSLCCGAHSACWVEQEDTQPTQQNKMDSATAKTFKLDASKGGCTGMFWR